MAEYLLEIGMEEMPAAYMNGAVSDLKKNAQALFETVRLTYDSLETYATPRRLVLDVKGLADLQEDLSEEVKGPSVKARLQGRADRQATGRLPARQRFHRSRRLHQGNEERRIRFLQT